MESIVMPSLELAAQKISVFEGFRSLPYFDSAKIPTIGFGTVHYPAGQAVTMNDRAITETEAICYLEHDLNSTALGLWKFISRQPTLNQWSALLSLAYNEGYGAIGKSTVVRLFNAGTVALAAEHFMDWVLARVDGKLIEIHGLYNRREAESKLFLTPDGE